MNLTYFGEPAPWKHLRPNRDPRGLDIRHRLRHLSGAPLPVPVVVEWERPYQTRLVSTLRGVAMMNVRRRFMVDRAYTRTNRPTLRGISCFRSTYNSPRLHRSALSYEGISVV